MAERESIEEAKARFEKTRDKLRKKFVEPEPDDDLPAEDTPRGIINGPSSDLSYRRMTRDIQESGREDDDEER